MNFSRWLVKLRRDDEQLENVSLRVSDVSDEAER